MFLTKKDKQLLIEDKFLETKFDFNSGELSENPLLAVLYGEDFEDQIKIFRMFLNCVKNQNKITKLKEKHYDFYDSLDVDETDLTVNLTKEKCPTFLFTNQLDKKRKEIFHFSQINPEGILIERDKDKYFLTYSENLVYSIRPSKMSSSSMVFEKNNEKVMILTIDDNYSLTTEGDNNSDIVIYPMGRASFFFRKSYFDGLNGREPDPEKCLAFLQWDIVDENDSVFLSALNFYVIDFEKEADLIWTIFMCSFAPCLIFNRKMSSISMASAAWAVAAMNIGRH